MFDRLKQQFSKLYDSIAKTDLKGNELEKVLDEFQLELIESDVAVTVADHVCNELKEKLKDVQFARFSNPRAKVKEVLEEVLLSQGT